MSESIELLLRILALSPGAGLHDDDDRRIAGVPFPEAVYNLPGAPQRWDEVVTHSQGKLCGTRAELIAEEQRRIEQYTAQGDLAPA